MANDIRDILDIDRLDNINLSTSEKIKKENVTTSTKRTKRPEGMAREVFRLLYNDSKDAPPIIPTDTDQSYKHIKAKLGMRKVRPWKWLPFKNPARTDNAVFHHWKRAIDEGKEYPFAKFNKKVEISKYTNNEYIQHLKSEDWSREETDHLLDLCERFDLRFIVVHDRYNKEKYKPRSVEDIKERYYFISNTLHKVRHVPGTPYVEPKGYDADHERRRKEQLRRLYDRTPEQVEEEQMLIQELRKIEARKKEREKKAQDLQRLITGADTSSPDIRKQERKSTVGRRSKLQGQIRQARIDPTVTEMIGIKFPDQRTSGATLRSMRMRLPPSVGQKKTKTIEQSLKDLNIDTNPVPTEEICSLYNDLRSEIVVLNEIKSAISTCLFEIQTFKHQYEAMKPGQTLEIPDILLTSTEIKSEETGQ